MRRLAAVLVASIFVTGLASAQTKVIQTSPKGSAVMTPVPMVQGSLESARRIQRDEAIKLVKKHKAVFVDVRSMESYVDGHIAGALSIPESQLIQRLREVPAGTMIITYCA
jgi:3-mercaptopyruvate sulfurtransferase SseA